MKVGIMTWYKYHNYGSLLQATALNKTISLLGYEPIMINYNPKGSTRKLRHIYPVTKNFIKQAIDSIAGNIYCDRYNDTFDKYIANNFNETEFCDSYVELKELNKSIDSFVCGSDQIWSPLVFDDKYYLNFAPSNKIVAYAPSIGSNKINDEIVKRKMSQLINRFNYLSVREITGQKIIKDITGKDAKVVLDPTFLLDNNMWSNYENKDVLNSIKNNYIVCYFLGDSNKYIRQIEKFAKENNLMIINIPYYKKKKINKYNIKENIGPSEFITLIKNSSYVFTDSFHGTIFSINFNKNFYTYKRFKENDIRNQNSRVVDILNTFNLNDRLVNKNTELMNNSINYNEINIKLSRLRNESLLFLKNSLSEATSNQLLEEEQITNYCCGCGSCKAVCPTKAIEIVYDNEGFHHYRIDKEKCINCGMCRRVCPMLHLDTHDMHKSIKLYSFKNAKVLDKSSSGGFSHTVAEMLNIKYYVCGVEYDNDQDIAKHIIIEPNNKEELKKIQGSKYIQSNSSDVYKKLIEIGKNNKVVFFGTPCQVAGLDKILKLKSIRNNFILIDIICHGVPTKYLWDKYLKEKCIDNNISLENHEVYFRDKTSNWRNRRISIKDSKHQYIKSESKDDFYSIFRRGTCDMRSCYECPYRQKSSSDIRIGDYWGNRFIKDKTGVSMVITNTNIGDEVLNKLKEVNQYEISEYPLNDYWDVQYPSNQLAPIFRNDLIDELKSDNKSIHTIRKKYHMCDDIAEKVMKIVNKIRVKRL